MKRPFYSAEDFEVPKGYTENSTMMAQLANARILPLLKALEVYEAEFEDMAVAWIPIHLLDSTTQNYVKRARTALETVKGILGE